MLAGVSFGADGGWAVGSQTVVSVQDGGWTQKKGPTGTDPYTLTDVKVIDASNGWAVGSWAVSVGGSTYVYGMALQLKNGTWSVKQNSLGWALRGVDLVDAANGWAVGDKGQLTRIENGVYSPTTAGSLNDYLTSVDLIDLNTGWAVGHSGLTRKLASGSWSTVTKVTSASLYDVVLSDASTGWAVGSDGTLLRLDQGSWSIVPSPTNRTLYSVALSTSGTVWAVGQGGTILRNASGTWEQCVYGATSGGSLLSVSSYLGETWAVGDSGVRRRLE